MLRNLTMILLLLAVSLPAYANDGHPTETDADRVCEMVTGGTCLIRGATLHTATKPAFVGDVLVVDGKISAIGEFDAPGDLLVIDATGMHLAPGVVDNHSHMAIERGINEGSLSITAEVRIADSVNADDLTIYRALAGGCTTARLLHGSANAIGGQDEVIKLKWKRPVSELRFPGRERGVKFALGENPKRSGAAGRRFPGTRMGVEVIYYRAFERAREYRAMWQDYEERKQRGEDPEPPRRDIRLDTLVGILEGEVVVHSHCYRADEILMLIRASQHFGFRIATLQHVLEGYKVAHEMAEAGVGGSTFGDWWGYKIEAYDAVPQNAAMMQEAGALSSVNSDSDEMVRRLYGEAAKSVRYAGMDPVEALKLVTLNSALQLGIGDRVGSIETGKDADLVLLNGDPLSTLTRVMWTMVDGEIEFERRDAFELDSNPAQVSELSESAQAVVDSTGGVIALVGGRIHPVTAPVIENGTLLMQDGLIIALGADVAVPAGAWTYDVTGRDIWPGMISLGSAIGLHEIGAVNMTDDTSEIGGNQPDLRVSASINADSAHIGVTRHNGVTRAQTTPQGRGPIRGQSSVLQLDGNTWEEMLTVDRDMLHIRFPRTRNTADKKDKEKNEAIEELHDYFEEAREYGDRRDAAAGNLLTRPSYDPRFEALLPYVRGEASVGLHASNAQTILFALEFAKEEGLDAVLYGAAEAWKVVDALAREQVPVVVGPIWALPSSKYDPYDAAFANAAVLHRAGVPFAIMTQDQENERNLPFQAGMAASFGLPREEAVRAVTYYPARILGLEDRLGSLAVGKIADVIVTDGHLLEITSPVTEMFIGGVFVDHNNDRQTKLYERYHERLQKLMGK